MLKMIVAPAALCAAAFLYVASPVAASPLAVNAAAISAEALSDVTLVQNRRGNRNNANRNRGGGNRNANRNRRNGRNAAAVGIIGGIIASQQRPVYEDDYRREVFYRCRHRRGFDPETMTYVNRYGHVRRCR